MLWAFHYSRLCITSFFLLGMAVMLGKNKQKKTGETFHANAEFSTVLSSHRFQKLPSCVYFALHIRSVVCSVLCFVHVQELKECCQKDEAKANDLRQHVLSRQEAAEETQRLEAQRRQEEETARMEAAYRREKEEAARRERDKAAREDEERLRREQRREKIRKEHEAAIKKAKIERVMVGT